MSNANTEPKVHAIHRTGSQQDVEEEYLDMLLNSSVGEDIRAETVSQPVVTNAVRDATSTMAADVKVAAVNDQKCVEQLKQGNLGAVSKIPVAYQLFGLSGLKLAIPLSAFTQVLPWPEDLKPAEQNQTWVLGRIQHKQKFLSVVDLAGLIVNQKQTPDKQGPARYSYASVIILQDGKTCLPCDSMADMVTVDPDNVCWRGEGSQRLWLAGTVKQAGYVVLDVDGIIQLISAH